MGRPEADASCADGSARELANLVPFVELLSRVRNVDVDELAHPLPDSPLLAALQADLAVRLPAVQELLYANDDYPSYAPAERRLLMEATAVATTMVTLARHAGSPARGRGCQGPKRLIPRARRALRAPDADRALRRLAAVVEALGERPVFATAAEFDAWMADETIFVFDPNQRPVRPE